MHWILTTKVYQTSDINNILCSDLKRLQERFNGELTVKYIPETGEMIIYSEFERSQMRLDEHARNCLSALKAVYRSLSSL
jgi:hypothetical protein